MNPVAHPFVSLIVPARNEARNIVTCLRSLAEQRYPRFEIIVVDDRSEDRTARLAGAVGPGRAESISVVAGEPLPEGWFGKPWACQQGARAARGDVLLFTDADTVHGPDLLARALAAMAEDGADALTLVGRQIMGSFWERLVQPHVFALLLFRFPDAGRPRTPRRWRSAIANGQYVLLGRHVYDALGGHAAVAGEVVEDMRLAQELVRAGYRLTVREAEDELATRMYRSLGDLIEGWSKNLRTAARQSAPPGAEAIVLPAALALHVGLWLAPPAVLAALALGGHLGGPGPMPPVATWALAATGAGLLLWTAVVVRFGAPVVYGPLYPLGALVTAYITALSWARGTRIRWKGRTYGDPRA